MYLRVFIVKIIDQFCWFLKAFLSVVHNGVCDFLSELSQIFQSACHWHFKVFTFSSITFILWESSVLYFVNPFASPSHQSIPCPFIPALSFNKSVWRTRARGARIWGTRNAARGSIESCCVVFPVLFQVMLFFSFSVLPRFVSLTSLCTVLAHSPSASGWKFIV